jgi:hypothetical protein
MENTTKKISLKGKTHFDVSSSLWTEKMIWNYINFQEGYNRSEYDLGLTELMRFSYIHECDEKQQKRFIKVYNKYYNKSVSL